MQQGERVSLQAKVKAQTIRQIFKDLSPKNLKGVQFFYLISADDQLEMQLISNAKDILIDIVLKKTQFVSYNYLHSRGKLFKYRLRDFTALYHIFANNQQILNLTISSSEFVVFYESGKGGRTAFKVLGVHCDEDDEDFLFDEKTLRPEGSSLELRLAKVEMMEGVVSYAKACKLPSLWFRYDSIRKALRIADQKERPEIVWHLKLEYERLDLLLNYLEVPSKMLASALNLLPNDEQLIMVFYSNALLLEVPNKQKKFTIKITAKAQND